ncbi:MAG: hypothetical protein ACPGXL_07310 [Chitinophagales bacterium]
MEDNYQNMDDFFKKQLNSFDEQEEGWEKPDSRVWADAQVEIGTSTSIGWQLLTPLNKLLGGLFLGTLLVCSIYILQLQEKQNNFENLLKKNEEYAINDTTSDVNKRQTQINVTNQEATTTLNNKKTIATENEKQATLEGLLQKQEQTILQLKKDKADLQDSLEESLEVQQGYFSALEQLKNEETKQKIVVANKTSKNTIIKQEQRYSPQRQGQEIALLTKTERQNSSSNREWKNNVGIGSKREVVLGVGEKMGLGLTTSPVRIGQNNANASEMQMTTFTNPATSTKLVHSMNNPVEGGTVVVKQEGRQNIGLVEKLKRLPLPDLSTGKLPKLEKETIAQRKNIDAPQLRLKGQQQWQVGYAFTQMHLNSPVSRRFERVERVHKKAINKIVPITTQGLTLGFMPNHKWQIQTGLHVANQDIEQTQQLSVFYDKTNEYNSPSGERKTNLELTSKTLYSESKKEINITLPQNRELQDRELMVVDLTEKYNLKYWQVPIGLSYIYGKNRLKYRIQGGMQWNSIAFENKGLEVSIRTSQEELQHNPRPNGGTMPPRKPKPKQFASVYGGIGVGYQLNEQWQAQAGLAYTHNLIKRRQSEFSQVNINPLDRTLKVGLQYQF